MQTIAGLATRLDMSAEEAVETLRKLRCDIEGVESLISNEQMDMLIQIDEDPKVLDRLLGDIAKKEDRDRKRNERLQQAAKRAAAKRKAEKEEEKRKEEEEKQKAELLQREEEGKSAKKKTARKKTGEEEEETAAQEPEPEPEATPAEQIEASGVMDGAEPVPVEPAILEVIPPQPAPEEEIPPAKPKVIAEILKEEPKSKTGKPRRGALDEKGAILIGAAVETKEPLVEIVRADGTVVTAKDLDLVEHEPLALAEEEPEAKGVLAEAERQQEEEERRRGKQKAAKPLPVPDPAVVAEVIRKAHERSRQKGGTKAPAPIHPETIDKDTLFRGEGKKSGKTAKKRQKRAEKARMLEDNMRRDAAAAVREYQSGGSFGMARRKKRKRVHEEMGVATEEEQGGVIEVTGAMTVEQLASAMETPVNEIILLLMDENILVTKNQTLELDMIRKIAETQGFEVEVVIPEEEDILAEEPDQPEDLCLRPPVITVMGHVDHGKTSLLDRVRKANVAAGEAGGITQHIAAYDVEMPSGRVVFLDTPGHEAFTHMRARGAKITDVVVLVVAADDGVRPQTLEALDHAKAGEVSVVVAINKCDKPDAQPDRVRQELSQYGLLSEEWGGKTIMRNISAKTGEGIAELLEMLVLESQMLELRANPKKRARGAVIESEISRGQGPVAWVLVQNGTLHVGDVFLCGKTYGHVRSMTNSRGKILMEAGPSTPVLVTGFNSLADAGDIFVVTQDERTARGVAEQRLALSKQKRGPAQHITLEDFHARMLAGEQKTLNVIIKADVQGSVDVLQSSLAKLGNEEVSIQIVHGGVGGVNESDILLASASDSVIIGFHVAANARAMKLAEHEGVEIRTYRVIYEAIDEIKHALEGLLAPESKEVVAGHAEVRQIFRSSALGNIAGCFQLDGETQRGAQARLIRDNIVLHDGRIGSVRRGKDDARSVLAGFECGIKLEKYDDVQVGDIIETYRMEQVAKTLS